MRVPTAVTFVVAPLSLCCSWLLVHVRRSHPAALMVQGPEGAAIGFLGGAWTIVLACPSLPSGRTDATDWTMGFTLLAWNWRYAPREAWNGWTLDAFRNLGPNIWLGLMGLITGLADTLVWEGCGLSH